MLEKRFSVTNLHSLHQSTARDLRDSVLVYPIKRVQNDLGTQETTAHIVSLPGCPVLSSCYILNQIEHGFPMFYTKMHVKCIIFL